MADQGAAPQFFMKNLMISSYQTSFWAAILLVTLGGFSTATAGERPMRVDPPADAKSLWEEERMETFSRLSIQAGKAVGASPIQAPLTSKQAERLAKGGLVSEEHPIPLAGKIVTQARPFDFSAAPWEEETPQGYLQMEKGVFESWTIAIESPGAEALRVQFENFDLPKGVEMYIYSLEPGIPMVVGPYTGGGPLGNGTFWSESVVGDQGWIEIRFADDADPDVYQEIRFDIRAVGHLAIPKLLDADKDESCFRRLACLGGGEFPAWTTVRHAVSQIVIPLGGTTIGLCTGTLINSESQRPFLLTANHCINSTSEAQSSEFYWDYHSTNCNDTIPDFWGQPRTLGSSFLAGSPQINGNDFSFLLLNSNPPAGRAYAGYTTTNPSNGSNLFRVHHPNGRELHYTRQEATNPRYSCTGIVRNNYTFSIRRLGGLRSGSSGSALMDFQGRITGQLLGFCGSDTSNPCGSTFDYMDGRFSLTFPQIRQWLEEQIERPANDNFSNRITLSGPSGTTQGNNVNATKESGEPNHGNNVGGASVWWTWQAPGNGSVTIETCGSNFDTTLGVYTGGSVGSLNSIAQNDDACGLQSRVTFSTVQGTNYHIAVDGFNGAQGNITLAWNYTPARYTLTTSVNPPGAGTVFVNPAPDGNGTHAEGTLVTLTREAVWPYRFESWSGDLSGTSPATTVVMNGNRTVTANFKSHQGVGWFFF